MAQPYDVILDVPTYVTYFTEDRLLSRRNPMSISSHNGISMEKKMVAVRSF
jgi:hypothetical protein